MNSQFIYTPFSEVFKWCQKSNIGSRQGKSDGKYKLYIASGKDFKYYDEYLEEGESLVFGTGGNPCIHYVTGRFAYTNHCEAAQKKRNDVCTKFYYYYFQKDSFAQLRSTFVGGGIKNSSKKKIGSLLVPVPPLPEQKRIVSRIEELFSQLDIGVETLRKIKQQLAVYRLAVLKAAYEGKYTQEWRINHPDEDVERDYCKIKIRNPVFKDTAGDENEIALSIPETWLKIRIGEIFDVEIGATPSRNVSEYWNGNIKWVSSGEVHFSAINETNEHITQLGVNNSSTKVQPAGTVLLAMIGEGKTRGQAAILNVPAAHNQNTAAILVSKTPCSPKYLYYFFMLNYENTRRVGSGNNQKALNKDRVKALRFPFTTFAEQAEIVREIELRLSVCDCIEQTVEKALQQAEAFRQSILKQAFEGKL
jgi:type I restriction enzyme S subunit